ncbi:hypothetical protein [Frankia sp. CiP3]|uniref:hypothetical protein n=1 Tax=Frankia sp. CiP3 TaxID=2880971 RepID=UPI001EF6A4E8|nr:hypothetical protein [Frankia sp. CiP3]
MPHPHIRADRSVRLRLAGLAALLLSFIATARTRWQASEARVRANGRDAGYSTEAILVTALLVAIALVAFAILGPKIIDKINSIEL